jgi:uncharacterized protein (DUF885 family)
MNTMNALKRAVAILLLSLVVAACQTEPDAADAADLAALNAFFERVADERRQFSPQALAAHWAGQPEEANYLGQLDIPSVADTEAQWDMARRHRTELDQFDRAMLTGQAALSWDIMAWTLDQTIAGERFLWHDYPVNQLMAIHNLLPGFITNQHPLRNDRDVDFLIQRLQQFPAAFAGALAVVEHRADQGIVPPRFALEKTRRDSLAFIAGDSLDNPLVTEVVARAERSGGVSEARLAGLSDELAQAVTDHVVPAYQSLADGLTALLPLATGDDGVWALPDGEAYYRHLLRGHTTTDMSPEDIHALGLAEVARIEGDMDAILCAQGYCDGTVGERMAALNAEPRFLFEDSDEGRRQIIAAYQAIVDEIELGLEGWFHDGPTAPVEVRRVAPYREATAFGAYYMRPAMDGSRPGMFFANLRSVDEHPRFGLRTLAYHEAIPGHHLQITRQQSMVDVPDFRRTLGLHAHAEGWALYAEYLAWEMGFHEDPFDNLGRLQAELFRAVRLVVDTGMHHYRWTREQGIDTMQSITGMPHSDVEAEIERYLVIPGQACAFKIGMMRMLAMRERAQQALGDDFDIRDFHRVVLDHGAMPLAVLDDLIDQWLADQ